MEEDLYDEFGNYIGPELDDGSDFEDDGDFANDDMDYETTSANFEGDRHVAISSSSSNVLSSENKIILHEDKKYYPDAEEIFPGVKTIVMEEDAQKISEPIIKPIKIKNHSVLAKEIPKLKYSSEFLASLMNTPTLVRSIAFVGQLHHGKTLFLDTLVQATQEVEWDVTKEVRYSDTRVDEQARQLSIKSTCVSLVLENLKSKSFLLNIIDCPGHVNFSDESTAALRAVDGVVIVVDAVEGVMLNTERLIKQSLKSQAPITVVINKMDRLILELKLPPEDAYFKLMHILEEINKIIANNSNLNSKPQRMSPELGNVCFASGIHGWSFTLESFSQIYSSRYSGSIDVQSFAKRLWGDWYHNEESGSFSKKKPHRSSPRTFVQYILEPLYKLYSQVIGEEPENLQKLMKRMGVILRNKEIHLDPKPLLKLCLSRYFGYPKGFVEMIVRCCPSPIDGAESKISSSYTGYQSSDIATSMRACTSSAPLMAHVVKMYNTPDGSQFYALTRIYSGVIRKGQQIRVLGEGFSMDDEEDMAVAEVTSISVGVGRFSIEVNSATAGNLVLLEGVDASIRKTATITDMDLEDIAVFQPLKFDNSAVFKLAVEPFNPSELPKMVEALRRINKSYPLVSTKVEESGEHVIVGTGELYMDCIMHDLRHLYTDMEVKVADPVVTFCETVIETSSIKGFSETTNKRNKLAMIAEPMDKGLSVDIEERNVSLHWDKKSIGDFFQSKYDWDLLAARSIWTFGPDDHGPNILVDDTLPSEVDKKLLNTVKESIIQGFKWGCREGPLCDEPIRNVKFKVLDASISSEPIYRGGGQIIPTARRSVYSSFLLASPRLMEPVYQVEIQCPADCVQAIYPVLARRRGHIVQDSPKPGAPFYTVKAFIPVIDSVGFEADIRCYTQGQAFCQQVFDHWAVVSGDPLDKNVILHPLEPSPPLALARDFMVKTRRRKGLMEDVSISKYFDDPLLLEIANQQRDMF